MFRIQVQTTRVSRKGKNICVTLLITFFMAFGAIGFNKPLTARAAANTYYVSTSGSDNNAGTLSKPWRTIQKAANVAVGGDTVLIRGGTYNERVDLTDRGNSSGPYITFKSYPGEDPESCLSRLHRCGQ